MTDKNIELSRYIVKELSRGKSSQVVINSLTKGGWSEPEAVAYVNEIGKGIEGYDEVKISELPIGIFAKLDYWFLRHNYFVWRCYHYIYYWNR